MKEQNKTPERELNEMEITNLSDAEFKILVIRMLTEMVRYGHKIEEEVKAMQSERLTVQFPVRECLGCWPGPQMGVCKRQPIDFFYLSFSLSSLLYKNK